MPANSILQIRKGTASQWTEANPVLSSGEPGYDITNSVLKIGDGVSNWSSLSSHKHNISDINSFASGVADTINTEMIGGSGISLIYNSQNNTVTISVTGIVSGGGSGNSGPVTVSDITDFNSGVSGLIDGIYAPLVSPVFTGLPIVPTANSGSNDNQIANTKFVRNEIASVINSAPEALDTLSELANALSNDSNFATTVTNSLSGKASLSGAIFTGPVTISSGSIDATTLSVTGIPVSVSGHSHTISDILDFDTSVDAKFDTNVVGGSGILLSFDSNTQTLSINALNTGISLSNTDSLPEGSSNLYFTSLRASGAAPVQSVAGRTGVVTLSSSDVGLGNVNNTSDINKPISLAVQSGLDLKAALSHTHTILDVFGLETSLNEKQPSGNYAVLNSSANFSNVTINSTGVSLSGHTHSYTDIANFSSGVASSVNTELVGGSGISLVYNSQNNTVNISVTGIVGGGGITGPISTTGITDFNTGVSGLLTDYAKLDSPALTGTPLTPTASAGTNNNQIASTEFVRSEIANLVSSAPSTLDTLNEIALSLNNDANFSSTIVSGLASKASLSGASFTGSVTIPSGSINANTLTVDNIPVSISGHTHIASNISGLDTAIDNKFDTSIVAGTGISLTYDSSNSTLTISVTGVSSGGGSNGPITTTDITDFNSGVSGLLLDYALTSGKLNQFSSTTSSEFSSIISDATGSGLVSLNNSPTLTGIPLAPTAPSGTNNNQIATTQFVQSAINSYVSSGSSGSLSGSVTVPNLGDLSYSSVSLLLHGEGTNSSTTIIDNSSSPKTISFTGGAQISTSQAKYGSSSIYLPASSNISTPSSSDFAFGSGDFTVEFWWYVVTLPTSEARLVNFGSDAGYQYLNLTYGYSSNTFTIVNENVAHILSTSQAISLNQWHHVAYTRASNTLYLFLDGVLLGTASVGGISTPTTSVSISPGPGGSSYFDDIRITKGLARYTSAFNPPTSVFADSSSLTLPVTVTGSGGGSNQDTLLRSLFLPPSPTNLSIIAGNAQVSLSWTAPTALVQIPIIDYIVQYSNNSGSTWTTFIDSISTANSVIVTGLTNDTTYQFRIAAINAIGQGSWSSTVTTTPVEDPFLSSVVTRLRMDGDADSQTFVDSSPSPKTVTAINGTKIYTNIKKYGTGSAGNFAYGGISIANGVPNLAGDFTIDMWIYFNPCTSECYGYSINPNTGIFIAATTASALMIMEGGANPPTLNALGVQFPVPSLSTWHHLAFVRQGTTHRIYVDGVEVANSLNYGPQTISPFIDNIMYVGGSGSWRYFDGYIDDFRVTNACRYPDGITFTPPTS